MNASRLVLGLLLAASSVMGQGTLNFSTKAGMTVDARVYLTPGVPVGSDFVGQLYAGAPGAALEPLGSSVPFRDDLGIGYITAGGTRVVPGVPFGGTAVVELRVWKRDQGASYEAVVEAGGIAGRSGPINVRLGGGFYPPAAMWRLPGIVLVPEPAMSKLGVLGMLLVGSRGVALRRRSRP